MWLDNASQEAVDQFWKLCGEVEPFPRNLERSTLLALPLAIVKLPRLWLHDVESWLENRNTYFSFGCQSRAIRGCLIAHRGKGLMFVDGADTNEELRFTIAHEVAHFIVDYLQPRERALQKFGTGILEVIDGHRPPNANERVHAVLIGNYLSFHTNLMERKIPNSEIWKAEDRADKIALALLAPPDEALALSDITAVAFEDRRRALIDVLCNYFGLPSLTAKSYSWFLLTSIGKGPSWIESLRLK
jgi:hypothetical protein